MDEDKAFVPAVTRRRESVLWTSLVALTMTLACYWRSGRRASGGRDVKIKGQDVASNSCGRTSCGWGVAAAAQEAVGRKDEQ